MSAVGESVSVKCEDRNDVIWKPRERVGDVGISKRCGERRAILRLAVNIMPA